MGCSFMLIASLRVFFLHFGRNGSTERILYTSNWTSSWRLFQMFCLAKSDSSLNLLFSPFLISWRYSWFMWDWLHTCDCEEGSCAFDTVLNQIILILFYVVRSYLTSIISTLVLYLIWTVMLLILTWSSLHSHGVLVINSCTLAKSAASLVRV